MSDRDNEKKAPDTVKFEIQGVRFQYVSANYRENLSTEDTITVLKPIEYFHEYLSKFRQDTSLNIFEIGMFEGGSAIAFALLFPKAKIVGIDSRPRPATVDRHIERLGLSARLRLYYQTLQTDRGKLSTIVSKEFGDHNIDLVMDDASHWFAETKTTFEFVYPQLARHGIYVIEDWAWAHWPGYQTTKWADRPALSNFAFELAMLAASNADLLDSVSLNAKTISVSRGSQAAPADFSVDKYIRLRGKTLNKI